MRHGSRAARSPPGRRSGRRRPSRSQRAPSTRSSSPPQARAVGAEADAVERQPEHRPVDAVLGDDRGDVRVMVLDRRAVGTPHCAREPRRVARAVEIRMQVVRDDLPAATSRIATRCATASSSAAHVGALSRSPMCCETKASSPRVTQTVFLK